MSNKTTQSQLSKLKPAQLLKKYNEVLGDSAVEGLDKEGMITAILAIQNEVTPVVPTPKPAKKAKVAEGWFGNQDTDKKHNLSKMKIPDDHYVVRHFSTVQLANGQQMEDPTSSRFQVYDTATFDDLNNQRTKDGKQLPSKFQELGLNVDVLHDPTED